MQKQENIILSILLVIGLIIIGVILYNDHQNGVLKENINVNELNNNNNNNNFIEENNNINNDNITNENIINNDNVLNKEDVKEKENIIIEDNKVENNNNNNNNNNNKQEETTAPYIPNNNSNNEVKEEVEEFSNNDNIVISKMRNIENETISLLNNKNDESILDKAKGIFITVVDFIFYDAEINGITFDELTDKGKAKVLEIANSIDNAIEKRFPNYKENISNVAKDVWQKASELIKVGAINIQNFSKEKLGEENYQAIINAKDELAKYSKNALEIIGEIGGNLTKSTTSALKEWYEKFREENKK
ncbi:MAG: hypothetical protein E7172_03395 [Firmicutes bacterium]|nr:hypothetical protein [Bacillota bacterium]